MDTVKKNAQLAAQLREMSNIVTRKRASKRHNHTWVYSHALIQGTATDMTVIVRECTCGERQAASVSEQQWKKATGDYARNEHYL